MAVDVLVELGWVPRDAIPHPITLKFLDGNGDPIDLSGTGADAEVFIRKPDGATIQNRDAVITDGVNGVVEYSWQDGDLDTADHDDVGTRIQGIATSDGVDRHLTKMGNIKVIETLASGGPYFTT